jgi:hypothetical protein
MAAMPLYVRKQGESNEQESKNCRCDRTRFDCADGDFPTLFQGTDLTQGYGFILRPPHPIANVDSVRLLVQWVGVCIVTGGIVWVLKD